MPPKTLQNWLLVYRNVVQKIKTPVKTTADFERARKTELLLKEQRTLDNRANNEKLGSRAAYKKEISEEKINSIYNSLQNGEKPFEVEFCQGVRSAKTLLHVLEKRDLNIISDDHLLQLMNILDNASEIINNHLTKKKKRVA